MAVVATKLTIIATAYVRWRKIVRSSSGCSCASSTTIQQGKATAAISNSIITCGASQPSCGACSSASIAVENASAERMKPAQSKRVPERFGVSRRITMPMMAARMPTGTFRVKIGRQSTYSTRYPPSVGPIIGATSSGSPKMPIMVPRCSGGATWNSRLIPSGISIPPPSPWITRKMISPSMFGARPHNADPSVNRMIVIRYVGFAPKRSER